MKFVLFLFLATTLVLAAKPKAKAKAKPLYTSNDRPVEIIERSEWFDKVIMDEEFTWLIQFHESDCPPPSSPLTSPGGHCRRLVKGFKEVSQALVGLIKVGAVDCNEELNRDICQIYASSGFPAIWAFPAGPRVKPIHYRSPPPPPRSMPQLQPQRRRHRQIRHGRI
jgi:hypothetical protein